MVRISKQQERRSVSRKRPSAPSIKTGAKKDNLSKGFKEHPNAITGPCAATYFIPIHKKG